MNLSERIQTILREVDPPIDQVVLGKAAGVSKGTVNQWLSGKIKSIKLEYARGIENAYGYRTDWLVLGKGPKKPGGMPPEEPVETGNRGHNLPLSDEAEALIQCVIRFDRIGDLARRTFAHHTALLRVAEELSKGQDADVVAELAKHEQLLASHDEPLGASKHAHSKKHK